MIENLDRKLDLSYKFFQMGEKLQKEGDELNDEAISKMGVIFMFLSGIVIEDKDVFSFTNQVSMFASKKILDNLPIDNDETDLLTNIYKFFNKTDNDDISDEE